jgi:hypothetical protein
MARWAEIAPRYQPDAERLIHLANELEALAQRLDDAAAVFGDGLTGAPMNKAPWYEHPDATTAPTNMAELFDHLDPWKENDEGYEIQIYQVGPNEFAVLLQGSDGSFGGINSLINDALPAGLGEDTEYARKVRKMLEDLGRNYPGAQIHFAGYSLGGIVAQQVASNQEFFAKNGLQLKTVSTYGAPKVGNVSQKHMYADFDAPLDIVSGLPLSRTPEAVLTTTAFLLAPLETSAVGVFSHLNGYQRDWSPTRQAMIDRKVPFKATQWLLVDYYDDKSDSAIQDVKTTVTATLSSTAQKTIETYNAATDLARDIARETGDFVGGVARETGEYIGDVRDAVQQRVPEPMRRIPGLF